MSAKNQPLSQVMQAEIDDAIPTASVLGVSGENNHHNLNQS